MRNLKIHKVQEKHFGITDSATLIIDADTNSRICCPYTKDYCYPSCAVFSDCSGVACCNYKADPNNPIIIGRFLSD